MRKPLFFPLLILLCLLLTQCEWLSKKNNPAPADELPPATQEGKNTFGCRVNGKVWTPKGFNGTANLAPVYEYPLFGVAAYRITENDMRQSLSFYIDSLTTTGTFSLNVVDKQAGRFSDEKSYCVYQLRDGTTISDGTLTVTKFDMKPGQKGIISGLFEITFIKPGCDTIRVTDGRFDLKL